MVIVILLIPFRRSFSVSYSENSRCFSGSLYDFKLMTLPDFRIISCSVKFVHGSGSESRENTSWYFAISLCIIFFCSVSKWSSFNDLRISCSLFHESFLFPHEYTSREVIVSICSYLIPVFTGFGSAQ